MQDYAAFLQDHAVNTFGCEATCSADCTNIAYYYPMEMVPCLAAYCECSETPIQVVPPSDFDVSYLKDLAGGDEEVWQYYLANKDTFHF